MRRLADQRDPVATETASDLDCQRKHTAAGLHCDLAEQRMRSPFDLRPSRGGRR
jgi:hypothetical protein